MSHLKQSIFINAAVDKVIEYVSNPNDWSLWYSHLSGPEKLTGSGEAGTVGEFKYSLIGMHLPMTIEVKENRPTPDGLYWEGTFDGPLHGTQKNTYTAKDGGTEVVMEVDYTVPGSVFGKVADLVIIERMQVNATKHTLENLKAICEAL